MTLLVCAVALLVNPVAPSTEISYDSFVVRVGSPPYQLLGAPPPRNPTHRVSNQYVSTQVLQAVVVGIYCVLECWSNLDS